MQQMPKLTLCFVILKFEYFYIQNYIFSRTKIFFIYHLLAYFLVKSLALLSADNSFDFQCSAASLFRGSSGLGEASKL